MKKISLKFKNKTKLQLFLIIFLLLFFLGIILFFSIRAVFASNTGIIYWNNKAENNKETEKQKYIKWFEFNVSYTVLDKTSKLDINSHTQNQNVKLNWVELISYLACKYGNDFSKFNQKDLDNIVNRLKNGELMQDITKDMKNYSYYFEGYDSVLHEFIGEYKIEVKDNNNSQTPVDSNVENLDSYTKKYENKYGIKAFSPIAKNYSFSHYDDFGASRSYGYRRLHFGNDLMGSIGTPIIAVESGIVEAIRMESIWWLENWN